MGYSGSVQVGVVARKFLPVSLKAEVHGDGDVAALARMGPADTPQPAKAATTQTVKSTWGLRKHGSYAKLRSASLSPEAFTEFSSEVSSGVLVCPPNCPFKGRCFRRISIEAFMELRARSFKEKCAERKGWLVSQLQAARCTKPDGTHEGFQLKIGGVHVCKVRFCSGTLDRYSTPLTLGRSGRPHG